MTVDDGRDAAALLRDAAAFAAIGAQAMDALVAVAQSLHLEPGEVLFRRGDPSDAVFLVVAGELEIHLAGASPSGQPTTRVGPGGVVGETQIVAGGPRSGDVRARGAVELLRISRDGIRDAVAQDPAALDWIVKAGLRHTQLCEALGRMFAAPNREAADELAARAGWLRLRRGEVLMREGDPADGLYVVLSGRLQVYRRDADDTESTLGQIGPGETVGEMALLAANRRTADVRALRDCHLAHIGRDAFAAVTRRHPDVVLDVARGIVERIQGRPLTPRRERVRAVAIVPLSPGLSLTGLTDALAAEMSRLGSTRGIDHRVAGAALGFDVRQLAADDSQGLLLSAWFVQQEAEHDHLLLLADGTLPRWTEHCVRHADRILWVADATDDPEPGPIEDALIAGVASRNRLPMSLLLVHAADAAEPTGTARWLAERQLDAHYHVRQGRSDDLARVARLLTGRAIGVVLGGGGARGAAHIGVLRAFRESGIPIDMIGGTSSGGGIAAQYAMGLSDAEIIEANIDAFVRNNPFRRLTLPFISLVGRDRMDATARRMYGERQIEDLRIDCFCVSCNLHTGTPFVHRRGPLWEAVRATTSIPGIAVPVVRHGELLVDGGVLDNLPGLLMRRVMDGYVVVVDVSPDEGMAVDIDYGQVPSPWRILRDKLNPFSKPTSFPSIVDVLLRTVSVSSLAARTKALAEADLVLRPPVGRHSMLDFSATETIAAEAYDYTMACLRQSDLPGMLRQGQASRHPVERARNTDAPPDRPESSEADQQA